MEVQLRDDEVCRAGGHGVDDEAGLRQRTPKAAGRTRDRTVYGSRARKGQRRPSVGAATRLEANVEPHVVGGGRRLVDLHAIVLVPATKRAGFSRMKLKLFSARVSSTPLPDEPEPVAMVVYPMGVGGYGMPERAASVPFTYDHGAVVDLHLQVELGHRRGIGDR